MVLRCRDKGATKPSFEKRHEKSLFSLFTKGSTSSSLRQSGDRAEPRLDQRVKAVPSITANTL